ncbi:MAG: cation:proton antiporter [Oligoflexus sp.]
MHLPDLIQDLAIILGVAAIVTFIFRLIKQPVVLGYIVAGIIVGPYTPPLFKVSDKASIETWAELGVIFLMFALGLEFSFRRLAKVGVSAATTAALQIVTMIFLGYTLAQILGWSTMNAAFLGCMIAISSTTIIIKALEELHLKTRRFAELVFGILIVEDLAAIVMLVALSSIATKASLSGMDLLGVGGKMLLIVGSWLVIGMFIVPRFIHAVSKRGNNEMMIIVSLGLCLALVSLSAYFHFSVALGAFIMGSILAETNQAQRIEELINPLKDVFGAVFFVSVGMLLNPSIIMDNLLTITLICLVVIFGKVLSVSLGALTTGQTMSTSIHSGLSMAQIGEFSFIIATLGLSLNAIDEDIYPIIVAVSLITTFTTPYFIRAAPAVTSFVENNLPQPLRISIDEYGAWFQRRSTMSSFSQSFYLRLIRWAASAIMVITIFVFSARRLAPWIENSFVAGNQGRTLAWVFAFIISSPFIWGMASAFRSKSPDGKSVRDFTYTGSLFLSRLLAILLVGFLSSEFFPTWIALMITIFAAAGLLVLLKKRLEAYYHWFEEKFLSGINTQTSNHPAAAAPPSHAHLLPWEAHLVAIPVEADCNLVGQSLATIRVRERFGVSIVVIKRGNRDLITPNAHDLIFPGDTLLCFGNDEELERFSAEAKQNPTPKSKMEADSNQYSLGQIELDEQSKLVGSTIRDSDFQSTYHAMVVGVERGDTRIENPRSDLRLEKGDRLWIVGEISQIKTLQANHNGESYPEKTGA